jgi:hypothetical protein
MALCDNEKIGSVNLGSSSGGGGSSVGEVISGSVASTVTAVIDSFTHSSFLSCTYHFVVYSASDSKWKSFTATVVKSVAGSYETVYSVVGSVMDVILDTELDSGVLKIKLINNELFLVSYKAIKFNIS